ncbi:hypothetical protein JST56_02195 [Candidatus Dependentiae bacterium]|nr:hypothetical protein [Candidatus Dependentiae bacterium]
MNILFFTLIMITCSWSIQAVDLDYAILNGDVKIVEKAMKENPDDINKVFDDKKTPLALVLTDISLHGNLDQNRVEILKELLKSEKIDVNAPIKVFDTVNTEKQVSPLIAVAYNYFFHNKSIELETRSDMIIALLKSGKINDVNPVLPDDNRTLLRWAACNKAINVIDALLKTGKVDVNAADEEGNTVLHDVIFFSGWNGEEGDFAETIKTLVATKNININAKNNLGDTPLHVVVDPDNGIRDKFIVQELLKAKDIDIYATNNAGKTPLDMAEGEIKEILKQAVAKNSLKYKLIHLKTQLESLNKKLSALRDGLNNLKKQLP